MQDTAPSPTRRLAIALLSHAASPVAPTGAERSLFVLARGLAARGHRLVVFAPGPWALEPALGELGVEVQRVPTRACWLTYHEPRPPLVVLAKWLRYARPGPGTRRLHRRLAAFRPDVVHVNCLPHLRGAVAATRSGTPVVWHVREILPAGPRRRWFATRLARHATHVVAVSEAVAAWLREEGLGERSSVVHNGTEPAPALDPAEARRRLGLPPDGILVGLFGQIVPHKGPTDFVRAASRALEREPDLRFVVAGDGPRGFVAEVRRAMTASGHAARFHLLPPQASGQALVAAADVVCLATTTPDPFPRAVLEAMAGARPVAAYRTGGTPELVVDGATGLLVAPGDVDGLAAAFVRLGRDPELRRSLGQGGARRAGERFSLGRHVDAMESLLLRLAR
jgi:glycosyltransferase involved in cell wall biosynthesis